MLADVHHHQDCGIEVRGKGAYHGAEGCQSTGRRSDYDNSGRLDFSARDICCTHGGCYLVGCSGIVEDRQRTAAKTMKATPENHCNGHAMVPRLSAHQQCSDEPCCGFESPWHGLAAQVALLKVPPRDEIISVRIVRILRLSFYWAHTPRWARSRTPADLPTAGDFFLDRFYLTQAKKCQPYGSRAGPGSAVGSARKEKVRQGSYCNCYRGRIHMGLSAEKISAGWKVVRALQVSAKVTPS